MDIDAIRPGHDFTEAIADALDASDIRLAVVGRSWLNRTGVDGRRRIDDPQDLVRIELETALRRNIPLVPLLVQGAGMPAADQLPESLARFAVKQAFEISDRRWRSDVDTLIDELERLGRAAGTAARRRGILGMRRGPLLLLATAVSALLVTVAVVFQALGTEREHGSPAPSASTDVGRAADAQLKFPYGVAVDTAGRVHIADSGNLKVRRVDKGVITTIAGSGEGGNAGDGGPATKAKTTCHGLAVDQNVVVFIAAIENNNVRRVDRSGVMSTLAGNGSRGHSGDGGPAAQAQLNGPWDVDVGPDGSVYIADTGNHRIRRVDPTGLISTVAGSGTEAFGGDGGTATSAQLNTPQGVAVDRGGNLYISDLYNNRIRKVDRTGVITTVAGSGGYGYSGDGGPAAQARLAYPRAVAVHTDGTVYVADINNHRIRKVDLAGTITTLAGRGG